MLERVPEREEEEQQRAVDEFADRRGADGRQHHQEVDVEAEPGGHLQAAPCRLRAGHIAGPAVQVSVGRVIAVGEGDGAVDVLYEPWLTVRTE